MATAGEIPIMGVKAMAARGPIADVNRSYTQLESIQVSNLDDRIDRTFDALCRC